LIGGQAEKKHGGGARVLRLTTITLLQKKPKEEETKMSDIEVVVALDLDVESLSVLRRIKLRKRTLKAQTIKAEKSRPNKCPSLPDLEVRVKNGNLNTKRDQSGRGPGPGAKVKSVARVTSERPLVHDQEVSTASQMMGRLERKRWMSRRILLMNRYLDMSLLKT